MRVRFDASILILPITEHDLKRFNNQDEQGYYAYDQLRKTGTQDRREDRPNMFYPVQAPDGSDIYPIGPTGYEGRWRMEEKTYREIEKQGLILWKKTKRNGVEVWNPYVKYYAEGRTKRPSPLWTEIEGNKKASRDVKAILGTDIKFDFPKPIEMLERILAISNIDSNDIILDSFAGSGTTAHAVLNMNKQDGGSRKFILIEMCDYAETITAERVRRVINGYGEGKKAVEGTGGGFTFYELGETLLDGEYLNENVPLDKIRSYVYFTETKQPVTDKEDEPHYLGSYLETAYYFYYDKDAATTLDHTFLTMVKTKAESYVIYADRCILSEEELERYHITFKKIPRDITRL